MKAADAQSLRIEIRPGETVSALLIRPQQARACYVFAHGAGAGMTHSSMETIAAGLGERGIATLRYQFAYMEKGSKRPDAPEVAHAAVRAAVAGSRAMLSRFAAADRGWQIVRRADDVAGAGAFALPGVGGLAFLGFPLHPAWKTFQRARQASLQT
jgi:predicted alpha/beta-hydrolase family hydrolase